MPNMPEMTANPPGSFCWMELSTTDPSAAKTFYAGLFGWTAIDNPMGPDEIYTVFQLNGQPVSAGYKQQKDEAAMGIPPHWTLYIATADVDVAAARVQVLGGKIIAGPFDVATHGRMAFAQDPTGAVFALWQPKANPGVGVKDKPGAFCWADLMTPNTQRAKQFYEELLGWKVEPGEHDPSGYLHISNGETMIGGMPPSERQPPNTPPSWLLYYLVESCHASTAKLKGLGGRVFMGPITIPNVGTMSTVSDPQGAVFSLFEPAPRA